MLGPFTAHWPSFDLGYVSFNDSFKEIRWTILKDYFVLDIRNFIFLFCNTKNKSEIV